MEPAKETKKKDWAEMEDDEGADEEVGVETKKEETKKVFNKGGNKAGGNAPKAKKNAHGDFIVTSFNVDISGPQK